MYNLKENSNKNIKVDIGSMLITIEIWKKNPWSKCISDFVFSYRNCLLAQE